MCTEDRPEKFKVNPDEFKGMTKNKPGEKFKKTADSANIAYIHKEAPLKSYKKERKLL